MITIFLSSNAFAGSDGELKISKKNRPTKDCFEKINRASFALNQGLDKALFKPVAKGYRKLPSPIKITNIPALDDRVHVTGFVEDIKNILSTMSVVICPWKGVYGFRSRIIELMVLGIPIVTSREAVEGMGMESIKGVLLAETSEDFAKATCDLISDKNLNELLGGYNKNHIIENYSIESTYNNIPKFLNKFSR